MPVEAIPAVVFSAAVVLCGWTAAAYFHGYAAGIRDDKTRAVREGHALWDHDERGQARWRWRTLEEMQQFKAETPCGQISRDEAEPRRRA